MFGHYFILTLCVVAYCNKDVGWFNCKPKPGCSIAQCDPRPASQWFGSDGLYNEYPILCQRNEDSSNTEIDLLKKKNADIEMKFEKMEKDAEASKGKTEDAIKQISLLEKKNAEMERDNDVAKKEMKKEIALLKKKNAEMNLEKDAEDVIKRSIEQAVVALARSPSTRETVCYMGMKSGQIPDSAITSSSDLSANWAAHLGRLDNQPSGSKWGAWAAGHNRVGEWIQVDLGQPEVVAGVVTQGGPGGSRVRNDWVTSYKVSCGNVASSMTTITEHGQDKVFSANTDMNTIVVNKFPQLMTCRYIRIYPQTYNGWVSMRLEIIRGICKDIY